MEIFLSPDELAEKLDDRRRRSGSLAAVVAYAVGRPQPSERCVVRFAVFDGKETFDCDVVTPVAAVLDVREVERALSEDPPRAEHGARLLLDAPASAVVPAPVLGPAPNAC